MPKRIKMQWGMPFAQSKFKFKCLLSFSSFVLEYCTCFHSCSCCISFSYLFGSYIQFSWAWFSVFCCHKNKAGLQIGPPKCGLLCQIRWCGRSGLAAFIYLFIALEASAVPRRLPELCGMGTLFQFTSSYSGCTPKSFGCSWSNCDSSCFSFSLGIIFFKAAPWQWYLCFIQTGHANNSILQMHERVFSRKTVIQFVISVGVQKPQLQ